MEQSPFRQAAKLHFDLAYRLALLLEVVHAAGRFLHHLRLVQDESPHRVFVQALQLAQCEEQPARALLVLLRFYAFQMVGRQLEEE